MLRKLKNNFRVTYSFFERETAESTLTISSIDIIISLTISILDIVGDMKYSR